jgi:uncharacterized protein YlxW (UPF0749 family)
MRLVRGRDELRESPRPTQRLTVSRQWAISMAAALAVVGFVAAAQWNGAVGRQEFSTSAQQVLARQVQRLEADQKSLRDQIASAETQVQEFQKSAAGSQSALDQLNSRLQATRLAGGLTAVTGPGVVIEIADSKRVVPPGENPANYIVLVDDLRDIVNALWASGAEAISINGERLVSTTSIYGVGSSILVNTAFLSPVFHIEAIGADGLLDRFMANPTYLGRVAQRIQTFSLEFASATQTSLTLPAYVGNTGFRWGVPQEEP